MAKKVAIVQSNYIPWKGYFDLIGSVDEFILYDDVQYTRRDWRNRNLIKTPNGPVWLTVPVRVKGRFNQTIRETLIDGQQWAADHWKSLLLNYRRAAYFDEVAQWLEPLYRDQAHIDLSSLNRCMIEAVCGALGLDTRISVSSDYVLVPGRSERLADLCMQAGATTYVSGPSARDYLDLSTFDRLGLSVEWFDYDGYRPYPQLWGDFTHKVSVLDLLFNCGPDSRSYMKCFRS